MIIRQFHGNVSELIPIAKAWEKECNCDKFGMKPNVEFFLTELNGLINNENSDVLILDTGNEIAGLMGLTIFKNPVSDGLAANEHFFYVLPQHRGISSVRMIKSAIEWAKNKGCSHLILNASRMASSLYDRTCSLYEKLKFQEFEKSYIKKI